MDSSASSVDQVRQRIKRKSNVEKEMEPHQVKKKKNRRSVGGALLPAVSREPKVSYDFKDKVSKTQNKYLKNVQLLNVGKNLPKKLSCETFNLDVSSKINNLEDEIGKNL